MEDDKPITVNGITYANQAELDKRIEEDLTALAHIAYDMYQEHKARENRLAHEPGGFSFPADGRMCHVCMGGGAGEMWYDKSGMRCMDCQNAYKAKVIPRYVFKDRDNKLYATDTDLVVKLKVERRLIKKLIKQGQLKAREITHGKYPSTLVFLKRENPDIKNVILSAQT